MTKPIFIADSDGNYQTVKPATKQQIIAFAHELTIPDFIGNSIIRSHQDAVEFLTLALNNEHKEQFGLIFLSTKNQVIAFEIVATGNLTSAYVDPRTVVTRVLEIGANAVIAAHNHPSGSSDPSRQDQAITQSLRDALILFEVKLLDHIIIGAGCTYSFAEHGLI